MLLGQVDHWLLWQLLVLGPQREAVSKEDGWQAEATKLEVVLTGGRGLGMGKSILMGPQTPLQLRASVSAC